MTTSALIPILQLAVSPVILISAVGLLLLTLNNRLAQSINRARILAKDRVGATASEQTAMDLQIAIIAKRANLVRWSIVLIAGSALSSALLIISLFSAALLGLEVVWLYSLCFIVALTCLIAGLILFIWEVNNALVALYVELDTRNISHQN